MLRAFIERISPLCKPEAVKRFSEAQNANGEIYILENKGSLIQDQVLLEKLPSGLSYEAKLYLLILALAHLHKLAVQ